MRSHFSVSRAARLLAAGGLIQWLACFEAAYALSQDQAQFRKYLASPAHNELVEAGLNSLPPEVFSRCPAFRPGEPDVSATKPVTFDQNGVPNAGAWSEALPVRGCGNDTILHLNFEAGDAGKIAVFVSLPGTTRADLTLQRDAVKFAILGPQLRVKDCDRIFITNTRFDAFDPLPPPPVKSAKEVAPPPNGRAWREIWSVFACGRHFSVPMHFIPDAMGTQIVQKTEEIVEP